MILGLLQMAGGVFVLVTAKSAVHEILATAAFGFGVISFALAVIIAKIDDATKKAPERRLPNEKQVPNEKDLPGWAQR